MSILPVSVSLKEDAPGHNKDDLDLQGPICWKCKGTGLHFKKKCKICGGERRLKPKRKLVRACDFSFPLLRHIETLTTTKIQVLAMSRPGRITKARLGKKPGPKPRGNPENIKTLNPKPGEELCCLVGSWRIFQVVGGHRYSTEDVVVAFLAGHVVRNLSQRDSSYGVSHYLDLGTGIGSVLQMTTWQLLQIPKSRDVRSIGVEAQSKSANMARRSIMYNGVDNQCRVVHGDIRSSFDDSEKKTKFSLITGTPPYFKIEFDPKTKVSRCLQGSLPAAAQSAPARCEFRGGIEVYCEAASRHLCTENQHARFVVCEGGLMHNRERAQKGADEFGLKILSRVDVIPKIGKPILFSVYEMSLSSHKDAKPSMVDLKKSTRLDGDIYVKTLTVRDESGLHTKEYESLLVAMGMR